MNRLLKLKWLQKEKDEAFVDALEDNEGPISATLSDEAQQLTITGAPTGGTFTLTRSGQTTGAIPYNASAEDIETALGALSGRKY